jgi:hypothetical protein
MLRSSRVRGVLQQMEKPMLVEWRIEPIGPWTLVIHLADGFPQAPSFLFLLSQQQEVLSQKDVDQALQVVGIGQTLTALPELQGPGFDPHQRGQIDLTELFPASDSWSHTKETKQLIWGGWFPLTRGMGHQVLSTPFRLYPTRGNKTNSQDETRRTVNTKAYPFYHQAPVSYNEFR